MERFFPVIKGSPLFAGVASDDLSRMLSCLSARTAFYEKDAVILLSGGAVGSVGLALSGSVKIIKEDVNGQASILAVLGASETFGEVFACADIKNSPVTVQAAEDAVILFINYKRIVTSCSAACAFHTKLIENMLKLLATKSLMLNQKIEILSKRTTREKLLAFFSAQRGASPKFTIPYNREDLARYICADRSAVSSELGRMRDEGLIKFKRNHFEIL